MAEAIVPWDERQDAMSAEFGDTGSTGDTWWGLAARVEQEPRLRLMELDLGVTRLVICESLSEGSAPAEELRVWLEASQELVGALVRLSRMEVPEFPTLPDSYGPGHWFAGAWPRICFRLMMADAAREWELESTEGDRACVERLEGALGLAIHAMRQRETMYVILGTGMVRTLALVLEGYKGSFKAAARERDAFVRRSRVLDGSTWEGVHARFAADMAANPVMTEEDRSRGAASLVETQRLFEAAVKVIGGG